MCSFGNPPESKTPALSYPGISGKHFNPVEAQRVYAESVRKEKEGRYVHSYLDAHGKLGLDEKWANDGSRGDGLMPDYESLSGVYAQLGWQVLPSGQVIAPDPKKMVRRRNKSRERKCCTLRRQREQAAGLTRGISEPTFGTGNISRKQDATKRRLPKAKLPAKVTMPQARSTSVGATAGYTNQLSPAAHKVSSTLGAAHSAHTCRLNDCGAGEKATAPAATRGARYLPTRGSSLVQAMLRKNASAPAFATSKRAAARYGISE